MPRHTFSSRLVVLVATAVLGLAASAEAAGIWRSYGPGVGTRSTSGIAVDPSVPTTLYVGVTAGVFKSTDGAASWISASTGLPPFTIGAVAVDPSDSNIVYALADNYQVFKSTNGGASWNNASNGLQYVVWTIVIDPATPTTLYAAVYGDGIYKSTDGAASWSPVNNGLPAGFLTSSVAIDPETPTTVYASGYGDGVYKSVDSGASWNSLNNGLPNLNVTAVGVGATGRVWAGTLGGGVFRGSGQTWLDANGGNIGTLPDLNVFRLWTDPHDSSNVFVVTGDGLFRTKNSGGSWSGVESGLPGSPWALAFDPVTEDVFYGTTYEGVFKTTNGATSWSSASAGLARASVSAVAVDPATPTTVYAGTNDQGLFKSTNGGVSWNEANNGLGTFVLALAIDPTTPATLYAGGSGVKKSVDGAASWADASTGLSGVIYALAIDPATPSTLYAGSVSTGVFKSTTSGGSWTPANTGLTSTSVRTLAIDPITPTTLYAGTAGGVFVSVDGAGTWNPATTGMGAIAVGDLAIDPATPTTLYAATSSGLFRSINGAASWSSIFSLFPPSTVAVDPITPTAVYVGTDEYGVVNPIADGLTSMTIQALAVAPSAPTILYAGTSDGGVFFLVDCGNGVQQPGEECDDGNGTANDGCSPTCTLEPCGASLAPICGIAQQAKIQLSEKNPGKERLKVQWKGIVGVTTAASFGDPVGGSTRAAVCLYDDAGTLIQGYEVDRAGDPCSGKPCWAAKSTTGWAYKDKLAESDGITKIGYKGGAPFKGKADVAGANNQAKGQTALPTDIIGDVTGNTSLTVQLRTSDGLCVGATMTETSKDEGGEYKAKKQ